MISPVSFTSTYKVNNQNQCAFLNFQNYALEKEFQKDGVATSLKDRMMKREGGDLYYKAEQTLIVPDYMDSDVETFCYNNGIKYKKLKTDDLLKPEAVVSRIKKAPFGYTKVNVDAKKLEELAKTQANNIDYCKDTYKRYFAYAMDSMMKNGDKIPATTLIINPREGYFDFGKGNKELKRYVKSFGVERLNREQIGLYFSQRTNQPDHCTYFALRDLGMDKIPVYVDKQGYEAGRILGLFD